MPTSYSAMLMPILLCSLVVTHILNSPNSLYAQSSPITSSGLKTEVLDSDTTHTIMGGTRHGTNLFHSFDTFNVPRTHIANFQNDSGANTSNILARVTGDNPSLIFGTIRTTGFKDASLFLMNPAGIVFGPEATLNVGGSVTFTTADYLRLATPGDAQAGFFHANPNSAPIFTSAPVTAYGFLTDNSAAIAIRGSQLSMQPDQSISLIAGKHGFSYIDPITGQTSVPGGITVLGGALSAPNGHINIGSIASPGELQSTTLEPSSNIQGTSPNSFGNITLSENAVMNTSGSKGG
ncbi:MAG: filamentous hemagglutinin N-terminal domain-containing protein, partial [Nitrospira sp.]